VRAYWEASARNDYEAAGRCIGEGYTWIDHATGVTARTGEELLRAMEEDAAWSDRDFKINTIHEAADGTVVVQATVSGTLTGTWRSVEGRGQRVTHEHCTVFKFDDSGMITSEEAYYDCLGVMVQLGALILPGD